MNGETNTMDYLTDNDLANLRNKLLVLGFSGETIKPYIGEEVCIIHMGGNKGRHLVLIPSNVEQLNKGNPNINASGDYSIRADYISPFTSALIDLEGTIEVYGGSGLKTAQYAFAHCKPDILDLTRMDTHNVTDMGAMFLKSLIGELKASNLDTTNVKDMSYMFAETQVDKKLDLSDWKTTNLECTHSMFYEVEFEELSLANFDFTKVKSIAAMFAMSDIKKLELGDFYTPNLEDMRGAFLALDTNKLNLGRMTTEKVTDMSIAFNGLRLRGDGTLDLRGITVGKNTLTKGMFRDFEWDVYVSDKKLRELLEDSRAVIIDD